MVPPRAMLLCAGLGSRLGILSDQRPKPMLPVCGVPILEYGLTNLAAHGVREVVINLHHRGDVIERELGDGRRLGLRIQYSHEPALLGTGGGLKRALPLLDPKGQDAPFLSLNGKLIFDLDIAGLLEAHARAGDTLGTMVVRRVPDATSWGAVDVRPDGEALRVHNVLAEGKHMFCGVHVTRPSVVARLPDGDACMIRQGYLPWMHAGQRVTAYEHQDGYFAEHSQPDRYLASNHALLTEATLRHPPSRLRGIDPTARIHPEAIIAGNARIAAGAVVEAGARIDATSTIGPGARVSAGATLREVIVWAGATARGTLQRAIVTPEGVFQVEA